MSILLGKQYIVTLEGCTSDFVAEPNTIIPAVEQAASRAGMKILKTLEYRFEPQGLTYMLLLSQSHLLVHTWPEYDTMIVDLFICTPGYDATPFFEDLKQITGAARSELQTVVFEQKAED